MLFTITSDRCQPVLTADSKMIQMPSKDDVQKDLKTKNELIFRISKFNFMHV